MTGFSDHRESVLTVTMEDPFVRVSIDDEDRKQTANFFISTDDALRICTAIFAAALAIAGNQREAGK